MCKIEIRDVAIVVAGVAAVGLLCSCGHNAETGPGVGMGGMGKGDGENLTLPAVNASGPGWTGFSLAVGQSHRLALQRGTDTHAFVIEVPEDGRPHAYAVTVDGLSAKDSFFAPELQYAWQIGPAGTAFDPVAMLLGPCDKQAAAPKGTWLQPSCGAAEPPITRRYLGTYNHGGGLVFVLGQRGSWQTIEYNITVTELPFVDGCTEGSIVIGEAAGAWAPQLAAAYVPLDSLQLPVAGQTIFVDQPTVIYDGNPFYFPMSELTWLRYWELAMGVIRPSTTMMVTGCEIAPSDLAKFFPVTCNVQVNCS